MSRFYPPPQPFIGGRQPLEPHKLPPSLLDNPIVPDVPPVQTLHSRYERIRLWDALTDTGQQCPYRTPAKVVQGLAATADAPPVSSYHKFYTLLRQWDPRLDTGIPLPYRIPPRVVQPGATGVFSVSCVGTAEAGACIGSNLGVGEAYVAHGWRKCTDRENMRIIFRAVGSLTFNLDIQFTPDGTAVIQGQQVPSQPITADGGAAGYLYSAQFDIPLGYVYQIALSNPSSALLLDFAYEWRVYSTKRMR